jgi:short subunit dehydrogenase-like uncharacterized protein
MIRQIVVFGATGYTGGLVTRALVAQGVRPVIAARSAEKLKLLSEELGGLEIRVADVADPESIRALVKPEEVLISTVGPFARWGEPAILAAIAAGTIYFDSTGESNFIHRVFEQYHSAAVKSGSALITAFGFDWVPGNLAAALALQEAGQEAVRVDVGYFTYGSGGISGGTRASMIESVIYPSYTLKGGKLIKERGTARARSFEVNPGKQWHAASIGTSEHFSLRAEYSLLQDVNVYLGIANAKRMPTISALISAVTAIPGVRSGLKKLVERFVPVSTGGPNVAARKKGGSIILAETFSKSGQLLSRVRLEGGNGYTFTADILAWGAIIAARQGVAGVGALGPVSAFGLITLEAGAKQAGLERVKK